MSYPAIPSSQLAQISNLLLSYLYLNDTKNLDEIQASKSRYSLICEQNLLQLIVPLFAARTNTAEANNLQKQLCNLLDSVVVDPKENCAHLPYDHHLLVRIVELIMNDELYISSTAIKALDELLRNRMDLYPFLAGSPLLHNAGSLLCKLVGINQNNQNSTVPVYDETLLCGAMQLVSILSTILTQITPCKAQEEIISNNDLLTFACTAHENVKHALSMNAAYPGNVSKILNDLNVSFDSFIQNLASKKATSYPALPPPPQTTQTSTLQLWKREAEKEALKFDNDCLKKNNEKLQSEVETLKTVTQQEKEALKFDNENLKKSCEKLQSEVAALKTVTQQEKEALKLDNENLKRNCEKLQTEVETLKADAQQLKIGAASLTLENQQLKTELASREERISKLLKDLESTKNELEQQKKAVKPEPKRTSGMDTAQKILDILNQSFGDGTNVSSIQKDYSDRSAFESSDARIVKKTHGYAYCKIGGMQTLSVMALTLKLVKVTNCILVGAVEPFSSLSLNWQDPGCRNGVSYHIVDGTCYVKGALKARGLPTAKNPGDIIRIELDQRITSQKTLRWFVNDKYIGACCTGLPTTVEFAMLVYYAGDGMELVSLKRMNEPTPVSGPEQVFFY